MVHNGNAYYLMDKTGGVRNIPILENNHIYVT